MGQIEFLRAQFRALSRVVVITLSLISAVSSLSVRAKSSGGWLISNFSESPTFELSHVPDIFRG